MKWLLISSLLATLAACGSPSKSVSPDQGETTTGQTATEVTALHGHLLGHDGEPLALAQIHVSAPGFEPFDVAVAADGAFRLELPGPGWARLRITGVSHEDHTLGVLALGGSHELLLRLGTYARAAKLEVLTGFGMFGERGEQVALEFVERDDGAWVAEVEAPEAQASVEFRYQLANVTQEGRTMNGTQADGHVYDGGGDYYSVIDRSAAPAEAFEIVFDPRALPPADRQLSWSFAAPDSTLARVVTTGEELHAWQTQALTEFRHAASEGPNADLDVLFASSRARLTAKIAASIEREQDPVIRRMLFVAGAGILDASTPAEQGQAFAARALSELGPRDPLWSMDTSAMSHALELVDDPDYFAVAAREHPDPEVSAALWIGRLVAADELGDQERGRAAMLALSKPRFAGSPMTALIAKLYDPERPTAPGRVVPDFHLKSVDGMTELSPEGLRGKIYVLDFWATWCGPCVAEMPRLHEAYASLNGQSPPAGERAYTAVAEPRLELISISFDHDAAKVAKFRSEGWPMPWSHAVPSEAEHERLSETFGIAGIPTMVLVGPDGTILASSPRLDGANLMDVARPYL